MPGDKCKIEFIKCFFLLEGAGNAEPTILVATAGVVKYGETPEKLFTQQFLLTARNNSWKIVSDCVRIT